MKTLTLRFSLFIGCILLSLIKLSAGNGVPPCRSTKEYRLLLLELPDIG